MTRRSQEARVGRARRVHAARVAAVATLIIAVIYLAALAIFDAIAANRLVAGVDAQLRDTLKDAQRGDGFTTAAWDADPEKFKDRWERIGSNGLNDLYSANFDWVVTHMADMAIRLATQPPSQAAPLRWDALFTASRP